MYPNILFLSHDKKITFHSDISDSEVDLYNKKLMRDLKKSLMVNVNKNSAIVVLNQIYNKIDPLIEEIKKNQIDKIYFFVDDVFRIKHRTDSTVNLLDTHTIERDFKNTIFLELNLIESILNAANITDFRVFHCEKIPKKLIKKFPYKIEYFDIYLNNWVYYKKNDNYVKHLPVDHKITCFNHRRDWHRHLISALLYDQDDVLLTNSNRYEYKHIINNPYINVCSYDDPFRTYFLNQIKKYDKEPVNYIDNNGVMVKEKTLRVNLDDVVQNSEFIFNLTEKGAINLVTETRFYTPMQYISEKTFKPIMVFRPFIILGPPHTLRLLKDMGFKTFDKWWDESYDNELNHSVRFAMVYDLVQELLISDSKTLKQMLNDMDEILVHNRKNIKNISKYFFNNLIV